MVHSGTYEVEVAVPGLPGHRCWFVVSELNRRRLVEAQCGEGLASLPEVVQDCLVRWEGFSDDEGEPLALPERPAELLGPMDWGQLMRLSARLLRRVSPLWQDSRDRGLFNAVVSKHDRLVDEIAEEDEANQIRAMVTDAFLCCHYKWPPSEVLGMPCQLRDTIVELIRIKKAPSGGL